MTNSKPRLRIREAVLADARTLAEIHFAAFGTSVISQLLYPNGPSEDTVARFTARIFPPPDSKATPERDPSSSERSLVVAELLSEDGPDDGPGEIVAFARWALRKEAVPQEVWDVEPPVPDSLGDGGNIEMFKWFNMALDRRVREIVKGEPNLYLGTLVCLPHRQRLGAGTALLRWGLDLADQLGLVSCLEASPYGYGLYKRYGYEDVDVMDFKITERWGVTKPEDQNWGANLAVDIAGPLPEGQMRIVIMKRPPQPRS